MGVSRSYEGERQQSCKNLRSEKSMAHKATVTTRYSSRLWGVMEQKLQLSVIVGRISSRPELSSGSGFGDLEGISPHHIHVLMGVTSRNG
jgi:hypothetical protein